MASSTSSSIPCGSPDFEWRANNTTNSYDPCEGLLFTMSGSNPSGGLVAVSQEQIAAAASAAGAAVVVGISSLSPLVPGPGDDTTPPNGVQDATLINGIAVPVSSSGGWSHHAPQLQVYPSKMDYQIVLSKDDSLELQVTLEYTNPYRTSSSSENNNKSNSSTVTNESMMVHVAVAKTCLHGNDEELYLVFTKFQEYVPTTSSSSRRRWVDITANVDYTETADEVVAAVLADATSGQTAGKATVTTDTIELTLGPFSHSARLILVYKAEQVYTYQAMSIDEHGTGMGEYRLCPLLVTLPLGGPLDHYAGGQTSIAVQVSTPVGTALLSVEHTLAAYAHLKNQTCMKPMTLIAVTDLVLQDENDNDEDDADDRNNNNHHHKTKETMFDGGGDETMGYKFQFDLLPPRSCGILSWLILPNEDNNDDEDDFVNVERELRQLQLATTTKDKDQGIIPQAVIQHPHPRDIPTLQVPLPGYGPLGHLLRIKVAMPNAKSRTIPCFILNLTLSDKSGSTELSLYADPNTSGRNTTTTTLRQRFNEMAELRFLKRLESIPALVHAGVLLQEDVWMDAFLAFDNTAPSSRIHRVTFVIRDVVHHIVQVVAAIRANQNYGATTTTFSVLSLVKNHVDAIRAISPGGMTDFTVGPRTIVAEYPSWVGEVQSMLPTTDVMARCTFVEFDTDGGQYGFGYGYLDSFRELCDVCHVRSGVVTGFGSWLNQDSATRVAAMLGDVPAQLALQVPEVGSEGLDRVFRRGFTAWIGALRQAPPTSLKISAGSVSFPTTATSTRTANAVEVLAVRRWRQATSGSICSGGRTLPTFGPPDVANENFTATVLNHVQAADQLQIYVLSRLATATQLAAALEIVSTDTATSSMPRARVFIEAEPSVGAFLAYDWMTMLTTTNTNSLVSQKYSLAPLLRKTSLRSRLEEEVSFRSNIPSPSGITSYLGRCKTVTNRAPIDSDHCPYKPIHPVVDRPATNATSTTSSGGFQGFGLNPRIRRSLFNPLFSSAPASGGGIFYPDGFVETRYGAPAPGGLFGASAPASGGGLFYPDACVETRYGAPAPGGLFGASWPTSHSGGMNVPFGGGLTFAASSSPAQTPSAFGGPAGFGSAAATAPVPHSSNSSGLHSSLVSAPRVSPSPFGGPTAFGSAIASSTAPAPHSSNSSASQSFLFGSPRVSQRTDDGSTPLWLHAMAIPAGSNERPPTHDPLTLKNSFQNLWLCCQILTHDPSIEFFCDGCRQKIPKDQDRFHCFDCDGFDLCSRCRNGHTLKLHRVLLVGDRATTSQSQAVAATEDPLVSVLLQPTTSATTQSPTQIPPPEEDRWMISSKLKVLRFLLSVLHWWPLVRSMCYSWHRLPVALPDELARKLMSATNSGAVPELVEMTKIVIDSIMREENQPSPG